MQSKATTVKAYLAELPEDRRHALEAVRKVILKNLDKGYAESMTYGMIGYFIPHSVYPPGYHCDPKMPLPFASLASQKNHMSLGLMSLYGNMAQFSWFQSEWAKTGKKLDMGKACIRFKTLDDLPLELIGEAVRRSPAKAYIDHYEKALLSMNQAAAARKAQRDAAKAATGAKPGNRRPARKAGAAARKKTSRK